MLCRPPSARVQGNVGNNFILPFSLRKSPAPPSPHTFSPASPFHILIVSICHTWSVSTGSDAMTCCNDALKHFLQKRYISVQMLALTAIWKENNSLWNLVTLQKCPSMYWLYDKTLKVQGKSITWPSAHSVFSCFRRLMSLKYIPHHSHIYTLRLPAKVLFSHSTLSHEICSI